MKTKLLTAAIVCTLLLSITGCAADKAEQMLHDNVEITVNTAFCGYAGRGSDCGNGRKRNACPASFNGSTADKRGAGNRSPRRIGTAEADRTTQADRVRRNSEVK